MAGDDTNLPLFHGNDTKDPEQYWFLCEAVWTVRKTMDDEVKKVKLETTLLGHALYLFMKFVQVPMGAPAKKLHEIRKRLIEEFRKPKSKVQYITELKEIKQHPNETVWVFYQIFKTLIARVSFVVRNV